MDGYTGYGADILELKINNVLGAWGPFNTLHTYARSFTMASAGKAVLGIEDSYYEDNKGNLSVDIYEAVLRCNRRERMLHYRKCPIWFIYCF